MSSAPDYTVSVFKFESNISFKTLFKISPGLPGNNPPVLLSPPPLRVIERQRVDSIWYIEDVLSYFHIASVLPFR